MVNPRSAAHRRAPVIIAALVVGISTVLALPAAANAAPVSHALAAAPGSINAIQGKAHVSPMNGQQVSDVTGIVTAVGEKGFWFQDPRPDSDPATSDALFVFTRSAPSAKAGDEVKVDGKVTEFRPGGQNTGNLATTEIVSTAVDVASSGKELPAPTVIGKSGRKPPKEVIDDDANGDVEKGGAFEPDKDGIDFYESLEGMRVQVNDAVVTGPANRFGELPVLADGGEGASVRTARGGIVLRGKDANPERIMLDDVLAKTPKANVGDRLSSPATGVLDYDFGNFKLLVTEEPKLESKNLVREKTQPAADGELAVATFNVENLDPKDPQSKFDALAKNVVENLAAPDLLNLEEVQDDSGPAKDGTVTAGKTIAKLTDAIKAAGGPSYEWRSIDPADGKDGGEPGGNIRVGFLYRTDRGLGFTDKPGGGATTPVDISGGSLTHNPGRIDPGNAAFEASRKPLAGEFTWKGKKLIVIANHWNSKGGDDGLFGRNQPPRLSSEQQRLAQAKVVADFVKKAGQDARVIVAGDLNDFEFSPPVKTLTDAGLVDLPERLDQPERYGYVYQGNSQVLDHILVSKAFEVRKRLKSKPCNRRGVTSYDIVHINSEFTERTSDHDPSVVRIR